MWGKILGALFGLAILRLPGLFIGLLLGHWFDQVLRQRFESKGGFQGLFGSHKEAQGIFMYSTFAVMGHLAKSTGVVTPVHIRQAQHFMIQLGLSSGQKKEAQNAFRDGKAAAFPWQQQLTDLKAAYLNRPEVLMLFMEIQMSIALVDGHLTRAQRQILTQIADMLDFSALQFEQILGRYEAEARFTFRRHQKNQSVQQPQRSLSDAYRLLVAEENCTEQQLKKSYKRQMAQHHPDKLMAQGMPPEMQELAKQKAQEIQAAYELIKQYRGF